MHSLLTTPFAIVTNPRQRTGRTRSVSFARPRHHPEPRRAKPPSLLATRPRRRLRIAAEHHHQTPVQRNGGRRTWRATAFSTHGPHRRPPRWAAPRRCPWSTDESAAPAESWGH